MKKLYGFLLVFLMVFCFCACDEKADDLSKNLTVSNTNEATESPENSSSSRDEFYREHQNLTSQTGEFNSDEMLRVDLPQVGLENVYIVQLESAVLEADKYGKVYLLADDRYGGGMSTSDYYLLVTESRKDIVNDKMYVKDLSSDYYSPASMGASIYLADLDGNKDMEIILHECKGMSGGAGSWLTRVYDFKDGIVEKFTSYDAESKYFDTGFSCVLLKDNMIRIENSFTDYSLDFQVERENEDYFNSVWCDEEGNLKDAKLNVDSFYHIEPKDLDADGISEIVCSQYTWLNIHNDCIGTAVSVLKYDTDAEKFYVFDAYFEPRN